MYCSFVVVVTDVRIVIRERTNKQGSRATNHLFLFLFMFLLVNNPENTCTKLVRFLRLPF